MAHDVMRVSADRLLDTTQSSHEGLAWNSLLASTQPLTGFSHGASGIGAALFTAGAVLNDPRYSAAGRGAFAYERSTFDALHRNWPDYRILDAAAPSGPTPMMWTWCHGAPGVGVARLIALLHGAGANTQAELEIAIASTIQAGFGSNDSLCHGDLGNLDLLTRAREFGIDGPWSHHRSR
jgi:lantibiotic modifying enzyme